MIFYSKFKGKTVADRAAVLFLLFTILRALLPVLLPVLLVLFVLSLFKKE